MINFSFEQLRSFPWATLGRPEAPAEFLTKCREQRSRAAFLKGQPLLSIIVPLSSSSALESFSLTLESLRQQTYPNWEAIFVAPCEGESKSLELIVKSRSEPRFRWVVGSGSDSATLKNEGLTHSSGTWWGIVDPGDVLSPAALYQMVLDMGSFPDVDLFYSNEAILSEDFRRIESFLGKPDYSWFTEVHLNYIGRFWLLKKGSAWKSLKFQSALQSAHEHDYLLQLTERGVKFQSIPFYLYYRQEPEPPIVDDTKAAVEQHLARKNFKAKVRVQEENIKIAPMALDASDILVSAVICFRDKAPWTVNALITLVKQAGDIPLEIFLVNNQSKPEQRALVEKASKDCKRPTYLVDYDEPFNFARMHNQVFRECAHGRYFLFLNNDVELQGKNSLEEMVAWAQFPWVGTVGMVLRYPDGGLQHSSLRATYGGESRMARVGNCQQADRYLSQNREVFGSTFAACMVKRETFEAIGGLLEAECANGFGDVIFSFECLRRQLHNIVLGHITGVHRESASRGLDYEYWEEFAVERRYPDLLQKMVRSDLGENRVPGGDFPLGSLARQAMSHQVARKFPWILPMKPPLKKALRWFSRT